MGTNTNPHTDAADDELDVGQRVDVPYYEVVVRLPLDTYSEEWFDQVADAAGTTAAVSGHIVPDNTNATAACRAPTDD